jgi:chromosome partitioning protein
MTVCFAFCGQKGGTGKTTCAIATSAELVARGNRVLLVDADPQGSTSAWAALAAETGRPAPSTVAMGATLHKPGQLDAVAKGFDAVVIDCPPHNGEIMRAALMVADVVVLPCGASPLDAWALASTLELVSQARGLRPSLKVAAVVNRKPARAAIGAHAREVLAGAGLAVLAAELHQRVAYVECMAAGLGPAQYAPDSPAAAEVRALVSEIEQFHATGATGEIHHGEANVGNAAA